MEKIKIRVEWADKNYAACTEDFETLNGVVVATSKTFDGLKKELESALRFHIAGSLQDGDILPKWLVDGDYELEYAMEISALLHKLDGIITRSAIARATGINERQIGHYASGHRRPRAEQRDKIINGIHCISKELSALVL